MTEDARTLLSENILGTLATVNEDGSAWATPIHVFYDDTAVYWFSNEDKQHSVNIVRTPQVSLVVFSPDESRGPKGVYFNGVATRLTGSRAKDARQLVLDRLGSIPTVFETASAYRLPIGALNSSKSAGNCWYFYS